MPKERELENRVLQKWITRIHLLYKQLAWDGIFIVDAVYETKGKLFIEGMMQHTCSLHTKCREKQVRRWSPSIKMAQRHTVAWSRWCWDIFVVAKEYFRCLADG